MIRFGRFQLDLPQRELRLDGRPLPLGRHALDILALLVEAEGRLVTKEEILHRVWAGAAAEDNNLQVHISALRRALGRDRDLIKTISGRGYQLVAGLIAERAAGAALPAMTLPATNLPAPTTDLIGRDEAVADIAELLARHRMVTLTGAGGIGKTRLAVEVARRLLPDFAGGVWLAELAPLSDAALVPDAVAAALGLECPAGGASLEGVVQALGSKRLLLLLDNCEHLVDMAARLAETMMRTDPELHLIATSREPLRAEGEVLYRVMPLDVPAEDTAEPTAVLEHGAAQLFLARARAAQLDLPADTRSASAIGAICRRLDGIPLAIELAAARAATLGVEELAAHLDDRFKLLTGGRRSALPRQQTLRAAIDWSYDLLPAAERSILGRLAIFTCAVSLEAVGAVAAGSDIAVPDVLEGVANLVAKSLVSAETDASGRRYRLLETTRAYALEKLRDSGEFDLVARRHATYYRDLFARAEAEWRAHPDVAWLVSCRRQLEDLRAALDWAFSPAGDKAVGVALSATALPLLFDLSLIEECRRRALQALAAIGRDIPPDPVREMQLRAALAAAEVYRLGPTAETKAAWTGVLQIAQQQGDAEHRARALWGLWNADVYAGRPRAALGHAERFADLAACRGDAAKQLLGHRIIGISLHYAGDQSGARPHLEYMLANYIRGRHHWHTLGASVDQPIVTQATLARVLWLQGSPAEALRLGSGTVEEAKAYGHALSLCYVLVEAAIPLALIAGERAVAARFLAILRDQADRHGFGIWQVWARCAEAALLIAAGDAVNGARSLDAGIGALRGTGFVAHLTMFLGLLAEGLAGAGAAGKALAAVEDALALSFGNEERWYLPELLRLRGELAAGRGEMPAAEGDMRQALDEARRQGAVSWELRAATSLARLWHRRGLTAEAHDLLMTASGRFVEDAETPDLRAARSLLDELRQPAS